MQDISTTRTLSREDVLYPPIAPNHTGTLALDELHTMYWEESGNPGGIPAVFLHGGPGGGSAPDHRRFFDPAFYRIIVYDQRGAGRSTPLGELKDNTTPNLVADLERLRTHLSIERWLIFGGSWGSTLALAYAQAHPDRLLGLVPDPELIAHFDEDSVALAIARFESHYFVNHIFMPENALLDGLSGIRHLPCVVVQGRYDAVCPILSADDLYRAWPEIEYIVVA